MGGVFIVGAGCSDGQRLLAFVFGGGMMYCAYGLAMEMLAVFRHLPLVQIRSLMVHDLATGRALSLVQ